MILSLRNKLLLREIKLEVLKLHFSINLRSILSNIRWKLKKFFKTEQFSMLQSLTWPMKQFLPNSKVLLDYKHHSHWESDIQHKHLPHIQFSMDSKISLLFQPNPDTNSTKLKLSSKLQRMPLLLQDQQDQLKQLLQLKKKRKRKLKKSIWEIFSEETMMDIE